VIRSAERQTIDNPLAGPSRHAVLLVEEEPELRAGLRERLAGAGCEVVAPHSAEQGHAALLARRPQVVVADVRMPGVCCEGLLHFLCGRFPTVPVIMTAAGGTVAEAVEATRQGAFAFVPKPVEPGVVVDEVLRALSMVAPAGDEHATWRSELITRSPRMEEILAEARLVAGSTISVLIRGASGTGKEVLARAIHRASPRRERPFLAVNCSAIPEPLLESELFGHVKGAFSGASTSHKGLFQAADGGTLLLDEIGDMPINLQAKLLRVLEERQVRPVGSAQPLAVDVRILSATHRDLEQAIIAGSFRPDLYYRLNVVTLEMPDLRERREDVPLLAGHFLRRLAARAHKPPMRFSPEAMELMLAADWPGNVRQLYNVVEQVTVLCATPMVPAQLVQRALANLPGPRFLTLAEARQRFEREYLTELLKLTSGHVPRAADMAGRHRTDFYRLLQRHGIDPAGYKDLAG
jgi:two-component system response regulator GlrR